MNLNHFALRDGKIVYVPDVPKEPHFWEDATDHAQYKTSLAFAIANGIEVENQGEVKWKLSENGYESGKIYPLQCGVEVTEECRLVNMGPNATLKYKARVTFDEQPEMWNRISHISGYPRAFDGSRTYRITCDTVEIRNEIEPILDTINFLPKGYYFELVEVVEEYVAKICKSEPEAAGQEQTASLQKQLELLQIRDEKREARESNLHKENGGLHAQIESLQKQVEELREENERLKAKAMEDYRVVVADEVDWHNERIAQLEEELKKLKELIKSDSVFWALRNANKSPSTLGDVEDYSYMDLYNISVELRRNKTKKP